jgi:hypothetical protein
VGCWYCGGVVVVVVVVVVGGAEMLMWGCWMLMWCVVNVVGFGFLNI